MKKRIIPALLIAILLTVWSSTPVSADMGPKPTTTVYFSGVTGECYGTLLADTTTNGPHGVWDDSEAFRAYEPDDPMYAIWEKMLSYRDSDGFYFWQRVFDCTDGAKLYWGYYPPERFKVLIYFPATDSFAVSDILERTEFYSVFNVSVENMATAAAAPTEPLTEPTTEAPTQAKTEAPLDSSAATQPAAAPQITSAKSAGIFGDLWANVWHALPLFLLHLALTVGIEILMAVLFGFRKGRLLGCVALTNAVSLTLLHAVLLLCGGVWIKAPASPLYIAAEVLVTACEAAVYCLRFPKLGAEKPRRRIIIYAAAANAVTYALTFVPVLWGGLR